MIDPKRVTSGFVMAYVKWAVPIFLAFGALILSFFVSGIFIDARDEVRFEQEDQISKLQNELQAIQSAKSISGKKAPAVAVDATQIQNDKESLGEFFETLFNFAGSEQLSSVQDVLAKKFGFSQSIQGLGLFSPTDTIKFTSWTGFCENAYSTKYTWWCLVDFTDNELPRQAAIELNVIDGETINIESAQVLASSNI